MLFSRPSTFAQHSAMLSCLIKVSRERSNTAQFVTKLITLCGDWSFSLLTGSVDHNLNHHVQGAHLLQELHTSRSVLITP